MSVEKPSQRMTLREVIAHADKTSHGMIQQMNASLLAELSDLRELSRPVRRRSHYPTLFAIQNALKKLQETSDEVQTVADDLREQIEEIRDRSSRERINRL